MNCECTLKKITNYIKKELPEKEELEFMEHMESCLKCFDELELTFIMLEGLDMLDEGKLTSMDFVAELRKDMENRKRAIRKRRWRLTWIFWGSISIFVTAVTMLVLPFIL